MPSKENILELLNQLSLVFSLSVSLTRHAESFLASATQPLNFQQFLQNIQHKIYNLDILIQLD